MKASPISTGCTAKVPSRIDALRDSCEHLLERISEVDVNINGIIAKYVGSEIVEDLPNKEPYKDPGVIGEINGLILRIGDVVESIDRTVHRLEE